jgi:DNA repair exonuclease SbcCD ATPase subunit
VVLFPQFASQPPSNQAKEELMSLRTVMQAGPAKANELFAKLLDTSNSAVKTREKLFTELKAELELHVSLEEQHLFPVLRRNIETKGLVADAIKDNKDLRAKLAELEALPKNEESFPERLKELQRTFRQHARDDKRELLPAVQRALSDEQVQGVAEKMEAGVAEAERARQDEAEERRLKARQERERAERQVERQAEAERAQQAAAEQARQEEAEQRRAKARQERAEATREAEQQALAQEAQEVADPTAEAVARTATTAPASALHFVKATTKLRLRVGEEMQGARDGYLGTVRGALPNLQVVAALPGLSVGAMIDLRSAWIDWLCQTTHANAAVSQELVLQVAERQRRLAVESMQRWMEHNARIIKIIAQVMREGLNRCTPRSSD